ncbi:hypothetical protein PDIG_21780 [Penicillium digitatum PHI26]|uniref:Uncharacterized protein n=1 Tax=Penicillium digitatum (strain PHI26 / CECT 20796) TaxID=1170229 RepID=K9G490_PEND2|nr:hypothetical protein PDIG_21780 [Penicillium digitatum PHI26]
MYPFAALGEYCRSPDGGKIPKKKKKSSSVLPEYGVHTEYMRSTEKEYPIDEAICTDYQKFLRGRAPIALLAIPTYIAQSMY